MIWVYATSSVSFNDIYVSMTNNLEERVKKHNKGRERTIKETKREIKMPRWRNW
ncbi:MAG: GIY-YIG nuclease family protein [Eudoraea sp.]|nr:GIY-YIG nuclease family protein [Eudoraea sp.]